MKKSTRAIGLRLRFRVLARDNFCCIYCGARPPHVRLEVDHIISIARGGKTVFENLATACFECNRGKREYDFWDPANGEKPIWWHRMEPGGDVWKILVAEGKRQIS